MCKSALRFNFRPVPGFLARIDPNISAGIQHYCGIGGTAEYSMHAFRRNGGDIRLFSVASMGLRTQVISEVVAQGSLCFITAPISVERFFNVPPRSFGFQIR